MNQIPRIKELYVKNVVPALEKELGLKNVNELPKLEKNRAAYSINLSKLSFARYMNTKT